MTLRELILSVDEEEYSDSAIFQTLRTLKPEYGSNKRIEVKVVDGEIAIFNVHVGSLGDILAYPINMPPELQITKIQLLDAILKELDSPGFGDGEQAVFWDDFDNLQKAKIIR